MILFKGGGDMETWLAFFAAAFLLGCLVYWLPIIIDISYQRQGSDDNVIICVYFFISLLSYKMEIPMINLLESVWPALEIEVESEEKGGQMKKKTHFEREGRFIKNTFYIYLTDPEELLGIIRRIRHYKCLYSHIMSRLLSKIRCEKLYWHTVCGFEDVAVTGRLIGILWFIKALVSTRLKRHLASLARPSFKVQAVRHEELLIDFRCIFRLTMGNVITAALSLLTLNYKEVT
jgi:hypothetical protein